MLTFGRVHVALTVEGRDQRRHVSAVDARGPQDPTTDSHEPVVPAPRRERPPEPEERSPRRLFTRDRAPETAPTTPIEAESTAGEPATEAKQD